MTALTATRLLVADGYPPRPENDMEKYAPAVSEKLVDRLLAGENVPDDEREYSRRNLEEVLADAVEWDGFKLARDLDRHGWDLCAADVEILDAAEHHRYELHRAAVAKWVADNGIKLTIPVGSPVTFRLTGHDVTGTVMQHYAATAQYAVSLPGKSGMVIIDAEKVQ